MVRRVPFLPALTRAAVSAVVAVGSIGAAAPAAAAAAEVTAVTMVSETGDYIGQGASYLFHPGNGEVSLYGNAEAVDVGVSGGDSGSSFRLAVAAPPGQPLAVGRYDGAQRAAFRQAGRPGLDIGGDGRGCNEVGGSFEVLDIATSGAEVTRLHVLFEQHCEGGEAALFGEIRYAVPGGSTDALLAPSQVRWPSTYPGEPARPVPVTVVNTGASSVTVGTPVISGSGAAAFSVASSTCDSPLSPGASCAAHVRYAPTAAGLSTAVLTFPDSPALDGRQVQLSGIGESGSTSWRMRGDAGDYISGGQTYSWTPADATITADGGEAGVAVRVESADDWFTATFAPGRNDVLLPGVTYENARRWPFHDPAPGLDVSGSGRGCNQLEGRFTIHEIVQGRDGLERFSATFEQHCEGAEPALHGTIAYKASKPARPLPGEPEPPPEPEPSPEPSPEPEPGRFRDTAGTTHARSIDLVAEQGIAAGYPDGTFRPGNPVTRGQMAAFLARALDLPSAPSAGFRDTAGSTHERAIDAVAAAEVAAGFSDGTFRPDVVVTRGQMASLLQRALELEPAEPVTFSDTRGDVHARAIEAIAQEGIARGYDDGTYRPGLSVTRGQMATFLVRALDLEA